MTREQAMREALELARKDGLSLLQGGTEGALVQRDDGTWIEAPKDEDGGGEPGTFVIARRDRPTWPSRVLYRLDEQAIPDGMPPHAILAILKEIDGYRYQPPKLRVPVTVIVGERTDHIFGPAARELVRDTGGTFVTLKGEGHVAHRTNPELLAATIRAGSTTLGG